LINLIQTKGSLWGSIKRNFNGFAARNVDRSKVNLEKSKISLEQQSLDLQRNVYTAFADAKGA
jgi:outer membrane protein